MRKINRDMILDKTEHIKILIDQLRKELTDKDLTIEQKKILLGIHDEADDIMGIVHDYLYFKKEM